MALNIKNADIEALVNEVTALTGESKTEAIKRALQERKNRLIDPTKETQLLSFLEKEVWPNIPKEFLGKDLSQQDQDELLG